MLPRSAKFKPKAQCENTITYSKSACLSHCLLILHLVSTPHTKQPTKIMLNLPHFPFSYDLACCCKFLLIWTILFISKNRRAKTNFGDICALTIVNLTHRALCHTSYLFPIYAEIFQSVSCTTLASLTD